MLDQILARIFSSQWQVIVIVGLILLAAAEIGFWSGLRLHRKHDEPRKGLIAGTQGAVLGLLGLLLAFTFAMAVARYDLRRDLVLQEANAIGTAHLRAAFLSSAHQEDVRELLRRYVDVRLDFYAAGTDVPGQRSARNAAAAIQRELWEHTVAAGEEAPTALVASFVASLNEVIDLDAKRWAALHTHVPGSVWLLVLVVALFGTWASGYHAGAIGGRSALSHVLLPLLTAVVITLIADLDRPRRGLIAISQEPLTDLQSELNAP